MIANLLDQAQIEAGKFHLSLGDVQLRQLVEDVIEQMQPLAQAKQQSLASILPRAATDCVGRRR